MPSKPSPRLAARRGRKPKPRLLELRITLAGIEPPIWRWIRVPDAYTLDQLHRVIQFAFGWLDYRRYLFEIGDRRLEAPLKNAEHADGEDATVVTLRELALARDARFTYTYDVRDNWVHDIVVEGVYISIPMDGEPSLPVLFTGERAGPPENCGGPEGYANMVQALENPSHPEHRDYRLRAGDYDPDRFDVRMTRNSLILAAAWGAI